MATFAVFVHFPSENLPVSREEESLAPRTPGRAVHSDSPAAGRAEGQENPPRTAASFH